MFNICLKTFNATGILNAKEHGNIIKISFKSISNII